MCAKKDILGAAETGSGKTLAFAIPIVKSILEAESKIFFSRVEIILATFLTHRHNFR